MQKSSPEYNILLHCDLSVCVPATRRVTRALMSLELTFKGPAENLETPPEKTTRLESNWSFNPEIPKFICNNSQFHSGRPRRSQEGKLIFVLICGEQKFKIIHYF